MANHVYNSYLNETKLLDFEENSIKHALLNCTKESMSDRDKAISIHNFVRDEIKFGFSKNFWNEKASSVLKNKIGFCNNQSTLLTAMLRKANIPARIRVYGLSKEVLEGFFDLGTDYVDHAIV